ncbi:MAG: hypothetical protein LBJ00_01005 [Planctomycetaceae bacterium]|nr:hypothetical protein [Planctomycetaceae bacterium]
MSHYKRLLSQKTSNNPQSLAAFFNNLIYSIKREASEKDAIIYSNDHERL